MTLKHQVEAILKTDEKARNSDIYLLHAIWRRFYPKYVRRGSTGVEGVWLQDMYHLPTHENVKRVRAAFNAAWLYLPTDVEVVRQRKINEDRWREKLGYPTTAHTMRPTRRPSYASQAPLLI